MHTRLYRHLSAEERETVSLGLVRGHSIRAMARILGRAPEHRKPRVESQRHTRTPLSRVCGSDTGLPPGPVSPGDCGNWQARGGGDLSGGI